MKIFPEKEEGNKEISEILGISNNSGEDFGYWGYEINDNLTNDCFDHMKKKFSGKLAKLKKMMRIRNIELWLLVEYSSQCNLEFDISEIEFLSEQRISLCISCWQVQV